MMKVMTALLLMAAGGLQAQTLAVYYKRLGAWNMQSTRDLVVNLPSGITVANIVSMSAVIHSDPDGSGKIEVQNFESMACDNNDGPYRGRGGILQVESGTPTAVRFMVRPSGDVGNAIAPASRFVYPSFSGEVNCSDTVDNTGIGLKTFNGTGMARGYLKVLFLASGAVAKEPIALKSVAKALGSWDMPEDEYSAKVHQGGGVWQSQNKYGKMIPFSDFGVAASRIAAIENTIMSDDSKDWGETRMYSNLHRLRSHGGQGKSGANLDGGGVVIIDEAIDDLILHLNSNNSPYTNFFTWERTPADQYEFIGSDNRGFVRLDYVAGTCYSGLSGFDVTSYPGKAINRGDCGTSVTEGSTTQFAIEGSGEGVQSGMTGDSASLVYRAGLATNKVAIVRVDGFTTHGGTTRGGLQMRSNPPEAAGAPHMTVQARSDGAIEVLVRYDENGANTLLTSVGSISFPVWLALRSYYGYQSAWYSTSSSTSPPSFEFSDPESGGWIGLGTEEEVALGSGHALGVVVSNSGSTKMGEVQFRNFNETAQ
jgi:hypothetical protein